jgi:hypothetical protein
MSNSASPEIERSIREPVAAAPGPSGNGSGPAEFEEKIYTKKQMREIFTAKCEKIEILYLPGQHRSH